MLHQQFMSIKKDPTETISCFNHFFYMAYHKFQSPYNIPVEASIQIYLNALDPLTAIFLTRLPPTNIDTLERVFSKAMTFTKQANPIRGGLTLLAQAITIVLTYPVRVPMIPSQFLPWHLVPLKQAPIPQNPALIYLVYEPVKVAFFE